MGRRYARDWRGRFATTGSVRGRSSSSNVTRKSRRKAKRSARRKAHYQRMPKVTQLKNHRQTKMSKLRTGATALQTHGAINWATGHRAPKRLRPGSPISGNKNRRYISRTHNVLGTGAKLVGGPFSASPLGRAHSATTIRRSGGKLPKSGYVVEYSK